MGRLIVSSALPLKTGVVMVCLSNEARITGSSRCPLRHDDIEEAVIEGLPTA